MRFSSLLTVVMGLAVTGGSAFMANEYFASQKTSVSASEESALVHVVVASQDIIFGQAIEGHMLSTIAWPRDAVPANTVRRHIKWDIRAA